MSAAEQRDRVTAVVFDLFHTLVDPEDHRPPEHHRGAHVADLLGIPPRPFVRWWEELEEARTRGHTPPNPELFRLAAQEAGVDVPPQVLASADREYGRFQDLAIRQPRPTLVDTARQLRDRGHRLGLLSNAERRDTRAWVDSPLAPLFGAAVFSCDLGAVKPEPETYRGVLEALGAEPADTAYVADGGSDELTGAAEAGFARVIAARWFVPANGLRTEDEQRHAERDAHAVAHAPADLLDLLDPAH